jgi:hypothetical protein
MMTVIGMATTAWYFYRSGHTIDVHWFQIPGPPGAPVFSLWYHLRAILPVGFVFALIFWTVALVKAWFLNEGAHQQTFSLGSMAPTVDMNASGGESPIARTRNRFGRAGAAMIGLYSIYVPVANNVPGVRLGGATDEVMNVLLAAGLVAVVMVTLLGWCRSSFTFLSGNEDWLDDGRTMSDQGESIPRLRAVHRRCAKVGAVLIFIAFCDIALGLNTLETATRSVLVGVGVLATVLAPIVGLAQGIKQGGRDSVLTSQTKAGESPVPSPIRVGLVLAVVVTMALVITGTLWLVGVLQ